MIKKKLCIKYFFTIFIILIISILILSKYSFSDYGFTPNFIKNNKNAIYSPFENIVKNTANGVLALSIVDPYGLLLINDKSKIRSSPFTTTEGVSTNTIMSTKYKDTPFGYYNSNSLNNNIVNILPYCRYGGQYKYLIYNSVFDGEGHNLYESMNDLFYCWTTHDLLNRIIIPDSWTNDNLTIYCNDGNLINFPEQDLDFLTTILNSYKVCIIKNLDLKENNTIIYGFEVGNPIVDDDMDNFFNTSNLKKNLISSTMYDVKKIKKITKYYKTIDKISLKKKTDSYVEKYINNLKKKSNVLDVSIVSKKNCRTESWGTDSDSGRGGETNAPSENTGTGESEGIPPGENTGTGEAGGMSDDEESITICDYTISVTYNNSYNEVIFNGKLNITKNKKQNVTIIYDPHYRFYTVTNSNLKLNKPLIDYINLPSDFNEDLSRILLIKYFGNKNKDVIGYEEPYLYFNKGFTDVNNLKTIYKIMFNINYLNVKDVCNALKYYGALNVPNYGSVLKVLPANKVVCDESANVIYINTKKLGNKDALTLFKNIILDLNRGKILKTRRQTSINCEKVELNLNVQNFERNNCENNNWCFNNYENFQSYKKYGIFFLIYQRFVEGTGTDNTNMVTFLPPGLSKYVTYCGDNANDEYDTLIIGNKNNDLVKKINLNEKQHAYYWDPYGTQRCGKHGDRGTFYIYYPQYVWKCPNGKNNGLGVYYLTKDDCQTLCTK